MEKRINQKTRTYLQQFKNEIKEIVNELNITDDKKIPLLQFIYDFQPLEFGKIDFQKRKRGEDKFCGTHTKGTPHGEINQEQTKPTHTKKTVWAQDIKGIVYYIDDTNNVYHPQDVLNNTVNPNIIAKYIIKDGEYCIPSLSKK